MGRMGWGEGPPRLTEDPNAARPVGRGQQFEGVRACVAIPPPHTPIHHHYFTMPVSLSPFEIFLTRKDRIDFPIFLPIPSISSLLTFHLRSNLSLSQARGV